MRPAVSPSGNRRVGQRPAGQRAQGWLDLARPGVFYAVGVNGPAIAVDPAHDPTIVTLAADSAPSLPVSEAMLDAFGGE